MLTISELKNIRGIIKLENIIDDSILLTGGFIDSRICTEGSIYFCLKGRFVDGHDYIGNAIDNGSKLVVVDKSYKCLNDDCAGMKYPLLYCDDVENCMGQISKLWIAKSEAKIIGITGTNGKTTTKDYLLSILKSKFDNVIATKGNFNNFQGVPLTIFRITKDTDIAIIEMGTNDKGEIKYLSDIVNPDIALITNIGKGHLEKLEDELGVFEEKYSLFKQVINHKASGTIFVNLDDKYLQTIPDRSSCLVQVMKFFSLEKHDFYKESVHFSNIDVTENGYGKFEYNDLTIVLNSFGKLNVKNALAAISIAEFLGVDKVQIKEAIERTIISEKRGEVKKINNSEIILDCYNANPTSMMEVLESFSSISEDIFFIIGDMLELGASSSEEHTKIGEFINKNEFKFGLIYVFGEEMRVCFEKIKDLKNVKYFTDFEKMRIEFINEFDNYKKIVFKASRGKELENLIEGLK